MTLVGRHIGRYRILEQLGQGGMSIVYKGLDTALDREVAVKVLHAHLAGKEESRKRLAREAKAVARLHHPNILEVYDFAADDAEQAYIVTEYIRGHTLRHHAETMGFEPPEIAALVMHEVASALAQAHESGIIHRDLKPENVMVRDDGVVKLMDFGIAKIIDRDDRMTMTGALVGSPAHMAPEIIEGEDAGPESDVFSLGTMLFQFATGRLPFVASNTTATLKRILDGVYDDPRQLVPTVSDDLAEIIATCLARQPSSRYPDAQKLKAALHGYLEPLGLGRTSEEVQAFFADPTGYRKALKPRLCGALTARSEALIAEKRPARALAALNQVLALEPQHARAMELLAQMNQARKRQQQTRAWKRLAVWGSGAAVALTGAGFGVHHVMQRPAATELAPPLMAEVKQAPEPQPLPKAPAPVGAPEVPAAPVVKAEAPAPVNVEPPPKPRVPVKHTNVVPAAKNITPLPSPQSVKAAPVEVVFKLQPYGHVEIAGRRTPTEHSLHRMELPPGEYTVSYGCTMCDSTTERIRIAADAPAEFHHRVLPRAATVSFEFTPHEAQVRVRGQTRTASETLSRPFEIKATGTERVLKHYVDYEVSHPGYAPKVGQLVLTPGESKIQTGKLIPQ